MADRPMMLLSKIRTDGGTQSRASIRPEIVEEYTESVLAGIEMPAVVLFEDEAGTLWMADGFHRYSAYKTAKKNAMPVDVHKGTLRDAQLFAAGANEAHGLRRSPDDKRSAVEMLLKDADWCKASDRWIAEQCKVSHPFVSKIRNSANNGHSGGTSASSGNASSSSNGDSENSKSKRRTGKDGRSRAAPDKPILCQRCATVGQETPATGCSKCQAERAKAKQKKKDAKKKKQDEKNGETTEALDAFKNPIPKKRLAAWSDPWIQQTFDTLSVCLDQLLQARLAAGMDKRKTHYPFFGAKDFIDGYGFATNYLEQLIDHLKTLRPAGVCPCCTGVGCGECRQSGLVPRETYKALKEKVKAK